MGFVALACVILGAGLLLETHMFPHYAAPATGLVFLLFVQSLRHIRLLRWRDFRVGRMVVWASRRSRLPPVDFICSADTGRAEVALRRGQLLSQVADDDTSSSSGGARQVDDEWVYKGGHHLRALSGRGI
jgi:hypothetical protein